MSELGIIGHNLTRRQFDESTINLSIDIAVTQLGYNQHTLGYNRHPGAYSG
jgi:hypothetical protein